MQYTGKPFQRRPWDEFTNGLIQHFDGITVSQVTKQPAFYFCFHTATAWLVKNEIKCANEKGWSWPAIVLENFAVDSLVSATGVLVTDGVVPETKFDLTIRRGNFKNLDDDSCLLNIKNVNLGHLVIEHISMSAAQNPVMILEQCSADSITLRGVSDCILDLTKSPAIKRVERYGCQNCKLLGTAQAVDFALPKVVDGTILGSIAVAVSLNGEIFTTEAANLRFNVKAPQ